MYIETVKKTMNLPNSVRILDTTLRDGEQTPGVAITVDEKIRIAKKLDKLGVDTMEVGFPASSPGEMRAAREILKLGLNSKICGLARPLTNDSRCCNRLWSRLHSHIYRNISPSQTI